jgi:hypothetical protein
MGESVMKHLLISMALCVPLLAHAQPKPCDCQPWSDDEQWFAMVVDHNLFGGPGPWLRWACYSQIIPPGSETAPAPFYCTIAQPWGAIDLRKLGDRIETIRASADPRAAFIASWKRHVTLPLSDPSLAGMRAAMRAALPASAASAP